MEVDTASTGASKLKSAEHTHTGGSAVNYRTLVYVRLRTPRPEASSSLGDLVESGPGSVLHTTAPCWPAFWQKAPADSYINKDKITFDPEGATERIDAWLRIQGCIQDPRVAPTSLARPPMCGVQLGPRPRAETSTFNTISAGHVAYVRHTTLPLLEYYSTRVDLPSDAEMARRKRGCQGS